MRLSLIPVVAVVGAAAFSAALVGIGTWDRTKTGLLVGMSVIAAATLVRLARGLPFTNPDHLDPEEVDELTAAVMQLARSLRALLVVAFCAMILLVLAQPIANALGRLQLSPTMMGALLRAESALIGAALGYVLARMWQIVGSDIALLDKQAKLVVRAVRRKEAKRAEERAAKSEDVPFRTPEGYGRQLQ